MSRRRFGRSQKAMTLLPLALLSAAWTAGLAAPSVTASPVADEIPVDLPDGTSVPTEAIEAPASVSRPGAVAPGVPAGRGAAAVRSASTNGIPAAALAAYQRAETVINRADAQCQVPWQLVAAIGRVESDHGRYGGNVLDSDGVAQPGIRGIPLDGKNGTASISDTDAGQLDADRTWDRAVGPMQFIPSTWSVVGVDADGDGERNPQDIDDAALATAVYLCSGNEDLSATPGQRAAVFRYNNSQDYVDLVLSIMDAYSDGDYSSVPTATASGNTFEPQADAPQAGGPTGGVRRGTGPSAGGATGGGDTPSTAPDVSETPSTGPTPGGGSDTDTGDDGGTQQPPPQPPKAEPPKVQVPKDPTKPVKDILTYAEAQTQCLAENGLRAADIVVSGVLGLLLGERKANKQVVDSCIARKMG